MVFSDNLEEIAIRDNSGNMLWLPYKRNMWMQNIWRENLQLTEMDKANQKLFRTALHNPDTCNINGADLRCNNENCTYRDNIKFAQGRRLEINGKPIDITTGGYIYATPNIRIKRFSNTENCRIWQSCHQ